MKSPCSSCEKHKTKFPKCLDDCETISDFQNKILNKILYTGYDPDDSHVATFRGHMQTIE